jgi:hypothetical protein
MGMVDFKLGDIGNLLTSAREALTGEKIMDPIEAKKVAAGLIELEQRLPLAQIGLMTEEAKHGSIFVAGARPFILWVCGSALALMTIPKALVITAFWCYQVYCASQGEATTFELPEFPDLGVGDIIALLMSLLGLAGLRTYEKSKGIHSTKVL